MTLYSLVKSINVLIPELKKYRLLFFVRIIDYVFNTQNGSLKLQLTTILEAPLDTKR